MGADRFTHEMVCHGDGPSCEVLLAAERAKTASLTLELEAMRVAAEPAFMGAIRLYTDELRDLKNVAAGVRQIIGEIKCIPLDDYWVGRLADLVKAVGR